MPGPTRRQYLAAASELEDSPWYPQECPGKCMATSMRMGFALFPSYAFIRFNDAPGRTKAEVLSALLGLAEVADQ